VARRALADRRQDTVHGKEAVHIKANGGSHGEHSSDRARGPSARY